MFHSENDSDINSVAVDVNVWVKPAYRQITAGSAESFAQLAGDGDFTAS